MAVNAVEQLLDAVREERDGHADKALELETRAKEHREQVRRLDRILAAAEPPREKAAKGKGQQRNVSAKSLDIVQQTIAAANGEGPLTVRMIEARSILSQPTISKAVAILHADGRIRLVRKEGASNFWGPV